MVLHGIAWYCMVLHGIALYCMVLNGIAWYCMILHGIAWYYMVLHGIECYWMVLHGITWYCMVLYGIALYYAAGWIGGTLVWQSAPQVVEDWEALRQLFLVFFALFGRSVLLVKEVKGCVWSFVAILESLCNRSTGQGEKSVASLRSSSIISSRLVEVLLWDLSGDCRLRWD